MKRIALSCLWLSLAAIVLLASCTKKSTGLSSREESLVKKIGFDNKAMLAVKEITKEQIQQLICINEDCEEIEVNGITINTPEERTEQILSTLRPKLKSLGYLAFISEMNFGYEPDKIAVIKGTDQLEIIKIKQTNGINYDITTEDVIEKLKEWENRYPFEVIGADFDWVEIEFKNAPEDIDSFAEEIYDFCPDVVEQGTGSVADLAEEIAESKKLYLWWD